MRPYMPVLPSRRPPIPRDRWFESGSLQRRVLCEPLFNARQTGLDKQQAVQEKLALLACYREGINAHLTRISQRG
jgi:hypothetical protein